MKFFFDNNLPPRLAKAIDALLEPPNEAVHLTGLFEPGIPDVDWIRRLADERDWIIISGDVRITRNPHERRAWQQAKLTAFFLKKGWINQNLWVQAAKLILWWPDIMEQAKRVEPGAGFLVPVNHTGRFEQVPLT